MLLSNKASHELEQELNVVSFQGAPVGSLIAMSILCDLKTGNYQIDLKSYFTAYLRYFKYRLLGVVQSNKKKHKVLELESLKNKWLLTFYSSRPNHMAINSTVFSQIPALQGYGFALGMNVEVGLQKSNIPFIDYSYVPSFDRKEWEKDYLLIEKQINTILKSFLRKYNLSDRMRIHLVNSVIAQTQYFFAAKVLLALLKPVVIITEMDRYDTCAPIVLAGKQLGIKTVSMMHGVVTNPKGYIPILADKLYAWGEFQKKELVGYGANSDRIEVVGAPQLSNQLLGDKQLLRKQYHLSLEQQVVVLGTNNSNTELRERLVEVFCRGIDLLKNVLGIVKLHPCEEKSFYNEFIIKYPHIQFISADEMPFDDALTITDTICVYNSACAFDAVMKKVPLCIINIDDQRLGSVKYLITEGKIPEVNDEYEMKLCLEAMTPDKATKDGEAFSKMYCERYGKEAAQKAVDLVISELGIA